MKVRSMLPQAVRATGRRGGRIHFAAGQRLFALLAAGLIFVPLIFLSPKLVWALLAWNLAVAVLFAMDMRQLPSAHDISAERRFDRALNQMESNRVVISIENRSNQSVRCQVVDSPPDGICRLPIEREVTLPAKGSAEIEYGITPIQRGDQQYSKLFMRYEGSLRLAQLWATFDLEQSVRVYPWLKSSQQEALFMRSRQIQLQNRMIRQRGHGREFESLREFQVGDERRDICWTATARRSRLVTTLRQSERSQTIWAVVDCGRLMRARHDGRSKLDYAAETAMRLAQLANFSSDTSALLAYGQRIQQRRLPGRGSHHLHAMLDQLAQLTEEASEADHLHAAGSLLSMQKRRAMIVWITDLADLAITPEIVSAAVHASNRHFVVVAVVGQPDVMRLISTSPETAEQTYLYAAASETIRRRELTIAGLRSRGVHVIEVNAPQLTGAVLNKYLEAKQKNLI
jgi:uncharacterized protein (DUF58 family)